MLGHKVSFEGSLGSKFDVLPVATTTAAWPSVGTRRRDTVGRGLNDLDGVGTQVGLGLLGDRRHDSLARQAVAHEDDTTVVCSGYTASAGCDGTGFKLEHEPMGHEPTGLPLGLWGTHIGPPVHTGGSQASSPVVPSWRPKGDRRGAKASESASQLLWGRPAGIKPATPIELDHRGLLTVSCFAR